MVKEGGNATGDRDHPQVALRAPARSAGALFLPGGSPNKVREGEVPVIVQPRFHRVLLLRPRGAGARPLHDRAGRLCAPRVPVPPLLGSLPRAASSGLSLETLPLASLRSGGRASALLGTGPACSPAPPLRSGSRCGGRGRCAARASLGSGPERLLQPLESLIPRRSWRRPAISPEAWWPRSEGGPAAAGVRCAPSQ